MNYFISIILPNIYLILLFSPAIYALYLRRQDRLTDEAVCRLILITGAVLRIMYTTYTDGFTRQHDVGSFEAMNDGHSGYILYLMNNHRLPDFDPRDHWQFYHPPLHHIISALTLTLISKLGLNIATVGVKVLQFISTAWSLLFSVFAFLALKRLGLKGSALRLSVCAAAFHPTLIILSGSLNNDMLSGMLAMAAIFFTIRWAQTKKLRDIILIALSIGLGMFTKLTVGLIAPAVAAVFLIVLIRSPKKRAGLIGQFALFGAVCIPLGMFMPVRNYIKFSVPLNFVPAVGEGSQQHINVSPVYRLFDFSIYQIASPFTQWTWNDDPYNEFNPLIALLKNAMFDEETFFSRSITLQSLCTLLFFSAAVCALFAACANIMIWRKKETLTLEYKLLLTLLFAVIFGNYIIFCLNYPDVCTENMRYCLPLIFTGAASFGLFIQRYEESKNSAAAAAVKTIKPIAACAAALSIFVYTALMYYTLW